MANRRGHSSGLRGGGPAPPTDWVTFDRLRRETDGLAGHDRLARFAELSDREQESAWDTLAWRLEGRRLLDGDIDFAERPTNVPPPPRSVHPRGGEGIDGDPLRSVPAADYVEVLTGDHVPPSGMLHCPLPGHEDRTPSFKVFQGEDGGVWCFGCGRGGDIYSFAAALWGSGLHGLDFMLLRRRIAAALLEGGLT